MGYESMIYAVRRSTVPSMIDGFNSSFIIASLDMGKMVYSDIGQALKDMFDTLTDFAIYRETCIDGVEVMGDVITDPYGDRITHLSDKKKAIEFLKKIVNYDGNYGRFEWLLNFIRMFENHDDIYIVHYGY